MAKHCGKRRMAMCGSMPTSCRAAIRLGQWEKTTEILMGKKPQKPECQWVMISLAKPLSHWVVLLTDPVSRNLHLLGSHGLRIGHWCFGGVDAKAKAFDWNRCYLYQQDQSRGRTAELLPFFWCFRYSLGLKTWNFETLSFRQRSFVA